MKSRRNFRFFENELKIDYREEEISTTAEIGVTHTHTQRDYSTTSLRVDEFSFEDTLNIFHCNVYERSNMLERLLKELQRPKEEQEQGQERKGENSNADGDTTMKEQQQEQQQRVWDRVQIFNSNGQLDVVLRTLILKCKVNKLHIHNSNRKYEIEYTTQYIPTLIQVLPNSDRTLTELALSCIIFTEEQGNSILHGGGYFDTTAPLARNPTNIKRLILNFIKFLDPCAHERWAKIFHNLLSPSLKSFTIRRCHELSDTDLAEFLSILMGYCTTKTTTEEEEGGMVTSTSKTIIRAPLEELCLIGNKHLSAKTLSVVTQWLEHTNNPSNGATEDTQKVAQSFHFSQSYDTRKPEISPSLHLGDDFLNALYKASNLQKFHFNYTRLSSSTECTKLMNALHYLCMRPNNLKVLILDPICDGHPSNENFLTGFLSIVGSSQDDDDDKEEEKDTLRGLDVRHKHFSQLFELHILSNTLNDECLRALSRQLYDTRLPYLNSLSLGRQNMNLNYFSIDCIMNEFIPALQRTTYNLVSLSMAVPTSEIQRQIEFICDINRGGRRYLQKTQRYQQQQKSVVASETTTTSTTRRSDGVTDCSAAIWPLILNRVNHSISFPNQIIYSRRLAAATTIRNSKHDISNCSLPQQQQQQQQIRRISVLYYLLVNGALIDCLIS